MSGRLDWDVKSSYTYQALKKAKNAVEQGLNQAAEEIQDNQRNNSRRPHGSGAPYQQPPYQAEGYQGQQQQPGRVYTTPPPKEAKANVGQPPPYQVYEPIKTKRQKKKGKNKRQAPPGMMEVRQKSVACYYGVGICWLFFGSSPIFFALDDLVSTFVISIGVFFLCKAIFRGKRTFVPIPEEKVSTGNQEIDELILEGQKYLKKMREADIAIEDETVSLQIRRLEEICKKIFEFVAENPKKVPQIRKFMNYYLPTTMKLLSSYDKLEDTGITGTNISETMLSIERMMNTIVMAFEKQLDYLFADEAMDISTDITVLEGMLAQEGLTGSDFKKENPKEA